MNTHRHHTRGTDTAPTIHEIANLTARLRVLTTSGRRSDPAEDAVFLADKHALLARIPADTDTATGGAEHATAAPADHLDMSASETVWAQSPIRHGRWVWPLGEDGEEGYLAEGHDHRALAAINALGRTDQGPRWATTSVTHPDDDPFGWYSRPWLTPRRLWVLIHTTCGCTPAQHGEHLDTAWADPDWEGCPCPHWGLPPRDPDRFTWLYSPVPAGTPGAVAVTEVAW